MNRLYKTGLYVAFAAMVAVCAFWLGQHTALEPAPASRQVGEKTLTTATKWTVYVGLNDADAGKQLVPLEEAKARLNAAASRHVDGFTVGMAEGYWTNAARKQEHENTLVYCFIGATERQIVALCEEMKKTLNQESVLVERNETPHLFF